MTYDSNSGILIMIYGCNSVIQIMAYGSAYEKQIMKNGRLTVIVRCYLLIEIPDFLLNE
jgi:hypothetical protein